MAVELDSDERARVDAARLPTRPNYFSATTLQEQPISLDFEAFLILQDVATKASTISWIGAAGLLAERAIDRNAVAFEALVVDQLDTEAQLDEVTDTTTAFSAFRQAFQAGKFSEATEVGLLINDLQTMADELFARRDRLYHLQQVQSRVQSLLRQSISSPQLRQLQSWPTPILAY